MRGAGEQFYLFLGAAARKSKGFETEIANRRFDLGRIDYSPAGGVSPRDENLSANTVGRGTAQLRSEEIKRPISTEMARVAEILQHIGRDQQLIGANRKSGARRMHDVAIKTSNLS